MKELEESIRKKRETIAILLKEEFEYYCKNLKKRLIGGKYHNYIP